ncbi:MAG: response regulator transcription factor [Pseudomonadota bacterium]
MPSERLRSVSSSSVIRVGVADDHTITRYALAAQIRVQPRMIHAGEAVDGSTALQLVRKGNLDVLLLDLMMPGASGLDVLHRIKARAPNLGVVVFTSYPARRYALNALRLGANAYLAKTGDPEEIIKAIFQTATGERYLSAEVGELLAQSATSPSREPHENLTQSEFQILLHLAKGESSTQIAGQLLLSPKTISTYRTSLMKKMEARTNSDLTHYALSKGLLE